MRRVYELGGASKVEAECIVGHPARSTACVSAARLTAIMAKAQAYLVRHPKAIIDASS
jgi:hypothetical protein